MPLTPKFFFLLKKSTSFPDFISEKNISIDKNPCVSTGVWTRNFYVHDRAKWDLGWAASDVTSGTELKHSRDFWLSLEGSQTFLGYLWFIFYRNRARFLHKRTVSSSITIWSLATIWTTAMYIYFFHFEVRVARGDCRVAILPGSGSTICRFIWVITVQVIAVELTYSSWRVIKMSMDTKSR